MGICFNKKEKTEKTVPENQAPKRRANIRMSTMPVRQREEGSEEDKKLPSPDQSPEKTIERMRVTSRVAIQGVLSKTWQQSFCDKQEAITSHIEVPPISSFGVGISCKKGLKPGSPNQDDYSAVLDPEFALFCVFDGHGSFGHEVSNYAKTKLPDLLLDSSHMTYSLPQAIQEAFQKTNESLASCKDRFESDYSGTTASVSFIAKDKVMVGHVGDSRIVLGVNVDGNYHARRLTTDHKPNLREEQARIEANNGIIKKLPDDVPYRIFAKDSDGPGLSISRAIGDSVAQQLGVTSEPEITEIPITNETEYLIMCSDGVWEFITDDEALSAVSEFGTNCKRASEHLARMAWARWIHEEGDMVDDITALVVYLPWFRTGN